MFKKILSLFKEKEYPRLKGKSALVVDDGEVERKLLQKILERAGMRVFLAQNGAEGVAAALSQKPDVILMDHNMPELTGAEACKRLKTNDETKPIPVIILTGSDTPGNIIHSFDCGADQFLSKPVQRDTLLTQIEAFINTRV